MIEVTKGKLTAYLRPPKPRPKHFLVTFIIGFIMYLLHLSLEGFVVNVIMLQVIAPIL